MRINPRLVALLLLIFLVLGFFVRFVTLPMGGGDADRYLKMAQAPGTFIGSPWGYRIAVPYMAAGISSLSGISLVASFSALQFAMYSLFLTALFLWLSRGLRLGVATAGMTCLIFAFSYPGVYNIHNVIHVGFSEYIFVLVGCIALHGGQFWLLACVLGASCFVKESVGFILIPSFLVYASLREGWRSACAKTAALSGIFAGLHLLIRSGILFNEDVNLRAYTSYYSKEYFLSTYQYWGGIRGCIKQIIAVFGPLLLVVLPGVLVSPPRLQALIIVPIFSALQIIFATDVSRMISVGMPILLVFAGHALHRMSNRSALAVSSINCLYFLAWNRGMDVKISLAVSVAALCTILWRGNILKHAKTGLAETCAALKARRSRPAAQ